jgi:drug/metabolite transporter (DMT)-like permease
LLATALLWGIYTVWAKHLVRDLNPVPMFTIVSITTTLGFWLLAYQFEDMSGIFAHSPGILTIAVVSGLLCIAAAHPAFHYAQLKLGSALCSNLILLNPLITILFSKLIWPEEHFAPAQWVGAGLLLTGALMVTVAGHRAHGLSYAGETRVGTVPAERLGEDTIEQAVP